jgi:hypothetical protein
MEKSTPYLLDLKRAIDALRNETCCKLREANEANSTVNTYTSLATTNSTLVSGEPVQVYGIHAINTSGAAKYVKLYNKATAPTVGTDTPYMTFQVPANGSINLTYSVPIDFPIGLGFGITGAAGAADTTAVGAGDIILTILTK